MSPFLLRDCKEENTGVSYEHLNLMLVMRVWLSLLLFLFTPLWKTSPFTLEPRLLLQHYKIAEQFSFSA